MLFSTDLRLTCAPTTGLCVCFHKKKVDAHATPSQLSQHTRAVIVGYPSNGCRSSSISALHAPAAQPSAGGTAYSRLPWPAMLPGRPHGPTILASLAWLSLYSPTPPLIYGDGSRTSQPSYSPPRGQPLSCLPRLHVVPFVGLTIVHRPSALGAAWSMMSIQRP